MELMFWRLRLDQSRGMLAAGFGQAKKRNGEDRQDFYVVLATPLRTIDDLHKLCCQREDSKLPEEYDQSNLREIRSSLAYQLIPCAAVKPSAATMTGTAAVADEEEERDTAAFDSTFRFQYDTYELPSFRRWLLTAVCFTNEGHANAVITKRSNPRVGQDFIVLLSVVTNTVEESAESGSGKVLKTLRGRSFRVNRYGENSAFSRATSFARSPLFPKWASSESIPRLPEHPGPGFTYWRARNNHCAFVGQVNSEKIDCYCGQNEEDGFMHDCDKCGCWLHGHCTNLEEGHTLENFTCRACKLENPNGIVVLKSEKKILELSSTFMNEIVHDQYEDRKKGVESKCTSNGSSKASGRKKANTLVCCICRCEDSEFDESELIEACNCRPSSAMAHKSCLEGWSDHISAKAFDGLADESDQFGGTRSWSRKCRACASLGVVSSEILHEESVLENFEAILEREKSLDVTQMEPKDSLVSDQTSKKPSGFLSRVKVDPQLLDTIPPKKRMLLGF